jgi:hypothetical protein
MPNLTDRQEEITNALPATVSDLADTFALTESTIRDHLHNAQERGAEISKHNGQWHPDMDPWQSEPVADDDPTTDNLSERETYILRNLQTGSYIDELADDLSTRESVITRHLRELRSQGWHIYRDETTQTVTIEGDLTLRSSEHKGTRTRKANRWWEQRHNELVRDFRALDRPSADLSETTGTEDWVHVVSDVHAGDEVWTPGPDPKQVYDIDTVQRCFRYDTQKSLELAEYHGADYSSATLVWNGDFITNEGIYSGQFEDLDAWLDEQHDSLMEPMLEQVKAYAERFDTLQIVCQVGNHGENRASGTSRQANADLILFKSVRNTIAALRKHSDHDLENVEFRIGQARPYVNFPLRGGKLRGHARHGQDRKPYAGTASGHDEWMTTLNAHSFDVALMGHHHISGEIPWSGPPIICTGSMKPPGDFVDRIAGSADLDPRGCIRDISYCFGVADHGVTGRYPVKTHDFDYVDE